MHVMRVMHVIYDTTTLRANIRLSLHKHRHSLTTNHGLYHIITKSSYHPPVRRRNKLEL